MPLVSIFQVSVHDTERLDRFLADQLAISRTQVARLVADGRVRVNRVAARPSQTLARGDTVQVSIPDEAPPKHIEPYDIPISVVYEDDALLVVDKPAGLVVHPAPGHWGDTLLNALAARGTPMSAGTSGRPGIVHRLDKDTSGLLIVAKTDRAHRRLASALSLRRIERRYVALVWGHISAVMDIDRPISRHPKERKRMTVSATGRRASTRVEPVARYRTCDLVRVTLETGRTHQIRVHLSAIGHPVVGDPVYGGGGHRGVSGPDRTHATEVAKLAPRQVLHAARLAFAHPESREWLEFHSDCPADLRAVLALVSGDPALLARLNVLDYLGLFK